MRIRNKLITVQLVMTVTLLISIFIFALHMYNYVQIDDAEIIISKLDTEVLHYKSHSNTALNRRKTTKELYVEFYTMLYDQKEYITFFQNSLLYTSAYQKDKIQELRLAYTLIETKFSHLFLKSLQNIEDPILDKLISDMGINNALKLLINNPENSGFSNKAVENLKSQLNDVYIHHNELKIEYQKYYDTWEYSKIIFTERLTLLESQSVTRTFIILIILIFLAFYINYRITNNITVNLNAVNRSLAYMTAGNFSSTLHIAAGDEFGDLSRNFNNFIQQLWKKLDSMNVIMHDIGQAMNEDLNLSKIQANILSNITNHITTDSSAIFSLKGGELKMTGSKGYFPPFYPIEENLTDDRPAAARYFERNNIPLDIPMIQNCIESEQAIIIKNCANDDSFPQCKNSDSALYIHSLMIVPLITAGNVIGMFVLLRTQDKRSFSDLDYTNFSSFSDYAALTIDTLEKYNELLEKFEMQKEIGVAADIQKSLIPSKMPKIKGISSSAYTLAAKGVSGDYYDFFRMNKHTIGATVCDVAGKGVPASLVMVMIRTILRLVSSPKRGAAETLTMLNKSISGKIDVDRYATMAFFKIDLLNMKLNYSNAAHHPIQIYRQSSRKFYAVDSPGLPIGIDRDSVFYEKRISLYPGDIIFMYTDGFPEARNHDGDEYSTSRMLREIRLHCNDKADKILDSVVKDMQRFTSRASQHDDQTILIIKIDEDK